MSNATPFQSAEFRSTVVLAPEDQECWNLILLGPKPLTLCELLTSFGIVFVVLASACGVVALLWWLVRIL